MRRTRPACLALCAVLLLPLLAACEDPSGVGLSVLGPGESDPRTRVVPADSASLVPFDDYTGSFISASGFGEFRGLAGRVQDPLFGTSMAQAFFDFLPPTSLPEGFRDRPIEQARLRLFRTYAYGDTTVAVTYDLLDVTEDWDAGEASSDTLFAAGETPIVAFDVAAADSLVVVDLPATWVAAFDTTLRSVNASTLFHGLSLRPQAAAGAVFGFSGRSELQLISASDTVRFVASEIFSHVAWEPAAQPLAGYHLLQDGSGRGIELRFDLEGLRNTPVNTASVRINVDTTVLEMDRPAGFVRTRPSTATLFARSGPTDSDELVVLAEGRFDAERSAYTFSASAITSLFQRLVLGQSDLDRFVLAFPPSPSSLDALPLLAPPAPAEGEADRRPRAVLVVVPPEN